MPKRAAPDEAQAAKQGLSKIGCGPQDGVPAGRVPTLRSGGGI